MRNAFSNKYQREMREHASDAPRDDDNDPLQDTVQIVDDDDELTEDDLNDIGDLGNDEDIAGVGELIKEIQTRVPSRLTLLMHRVAESLIALRHLQSRQANPWPRDRVPLAHWRALADEALGLLGDAARRELDEQRLLGAMPESEREGFQKLCDSRLGLGVFRKSFERERAAWEQAYWRRALDESFGKRPWTGPSGGVRSMEQDDSADGRQ